MDDYYNPQDPIGVKNFVLFKDGVYRNIIPFAANAGRVRKDSIIGSFNKSDVGLSNVDNTSDDNKPVSIAQQIAINGKANTLHNHTIGDITGAQAAFDAKAPLVSPSFTTPNIGAATGISLDVTGNIKSSGGSIGYASGNGGTITQSGNKGNSVTLNKISGQITTTNAALAAGAEVSFNLLNNTIGINDVVNLSIQGGGTVGSYGVWVTATANGSCSITISNLSTGSLSQALVINFVVIKGVAN
jgi:hypothetical protein